MNKSILSFLLCLGMVASAQTLYPLGQLEGPYAVYDIVDGDTLYLADIGKVRLIGVDTPEKNPGEKLERVARQLNIRANVIQAWGRKATKEASYWLQDADVWLEFDVGPEDPYGRPLVYLYIEDEQGDWEYDGRRFYQVNLELMRSGWAQTIRLEPNTRYADLYAQTMREAQAARSGMWFERLGDGSVRIDCILFNPKGPDEGNENISLYIPEGRPDQSVDGWVIKDAQGNEIRLEGTIEAGYIYDYPALRNEAIWGNKGDTASLYDADNVLVDQLSYTGNEGGKVCSP